MPIKKYHLEVIKFDDENNTTTKAILNLEMQSPLVNQGDSETTGSIMVKNNGEVKTSFSMKTKNNSATNIMKNLFVFVSGMLTNNLAK